MAAKRHHDDSDQEREQSGDKRMRRLPSFPTVIREAIMAKSLQNILFTLEPLLRKVVQEEVERGVIHSMRSFQRSNSIQIEAAAAESSNLKLVFKNQLSLPIFTGSKIEDIENKPLQLAVVNMLTGEEVPASSLPSPIKLELLVLDGDFPSDDKEDWTTAEFQNNVVKERTGKRPLLTGDVNVTLRDGTVLIPDLSFTDNSSWIRSRHFRIGTRVVPGSYDGPKIKEAMTEPFMVKDHRGELYRKHYPPALGDEVWRLERIGKDGAFHKKLSAQKIYTVQDFLKLLAVDPRLLRNILGVGMSDRVWEATVAHAKTCIIGEKLYLFHGSQCSLLLSPVCEVVGIINGSITLTLQDLGRSQRAYVQNLVSEAYQNWDKMEETDALFTQRNIMAQNVPMHQSGVETLPWYQVHQENEINYQVDEFGIPDPAALPCFD
ncbi:protein SAR DEFICIENT 1-like [Canna indica]|uniref:Protein SAR DEFICIENT 1-like n=1 Tax=Canna indica TaxID=4628 RepID=A0AAQ3JPN6_9LILI|nr:protein SAR DEFICIENT 1-like [Canna indica]